MKRISVVTITFLVMSAAVLAPAAEAVLPMASAAADSTAVVADSTEAFPEKMKARETWENVVSVPGAILYAPFWLTFKIVEQGIAIQSRYRIANRVAALVISSDGSRGLIPVYSSRGGLGLNFFKKHIPNEAARFNLAASWGLRGRSLYQARIRRLEAGPLSFGGQLIYRNMPDERFYGFGSNTQESDETNYQIKTATAEGAIAKWFSPKLVVGVIAGVDNSRTGPGKADTSPSTTDVYGDSLPGLGDDITVARLMVGLIYDGANRRVRPSNGWAVEARIRVDHELSNGPFAYSTGFLDVIKYIGLKRNRTLFLRGAFRSSDRLTDKEIPFYETSQLGSQETIRGFHRNRFRELDAILATAEYRYPISAMIDALLFVDGGQVQRDVFQDFSSSDTQWVFGGGFRVWKLDGSLIRLELGVGEDGARILFQLNPQSDRRTFEYF